MKGIPFTRSTPRTAEAAAGTGAVPRTKKIFYGWWILAASAFTNGIGGSVHWQGFTVFFIPVAQGLGLSSAQTALPFALSRAENGLFGPITGWLIDRYGVRPLMLVGTIFVGIGYIWLSQTSTYLAFILVYLFVISLGASTGFMQASTTALNQWFVRRRGITMSINSAAFRLGGAFMVPLLSFAVLRWGWETAALWVGIGMMTLIAPMALFFRRSPESMGLRPDGDPARPPSVSPSALANSSVSRVAEAQPGDEADFGVKDALRTRAFWVLATGTVLRMSVHGAIFVHMVPILVWKGEGQQAAANLIGLLAAISVPLILFVGYLSDRLGRQLLLGFCYISSAGSLLLLTVVEGTWPTFLALMLFAGSEAGSALNWALVGDLFGRRKFATIRGILAPLYNTALLITPVAAGWVFDVTDSYRIVLLVGAGLMLAAAFTFLNLHAPRKQTVPA